MVQDTQELTLLERFRSLAPDDRDRLLYLAEVLSGLRGTETPPGAPVDAFLALEGALVFEEGEAERVWAQVHDARNAEYPCPPTC